MALNLNKDLKAYYSIKEVSEMFGLSASTLRYWEREFPHLKPRTVGNKVRQYSKSDIEELRVIYNLVMFLFCFIICERYLFRFFSKQNYTC